LLLLPESHPAIHPLKRLLTRLPRFDVNTPTPYVAKQVQSLHVQNLKKVEKFLFKNQLPLPAHFLLMARHPKHLHFLDQPLNPTLHFQHPIYQLSRILEIFSLIMVPADKTRIFTIMPKGILELELQIHLKDTNTYEIISNDQLKMYENIQQKAIDEAIQYFNKQDLIIEAPSKRYIYFLPKVHKSITDWRVEYLHPKMRPIVCDTNSNTYKLAKFLLPTLQKLEEKITSTVISSLQVAHNISQLNSLLTTKTPSTTILLTTVDVESLFTRIPLDKLLQVIEDLLIHELPDYQHRHQILQCLSSIINFNTFQVNEGYCLQKIGLPMGGPISGILANIYLGYYERKVINNEHVLLYNRYMDDVLILSTFTEDELNNFLICLQNVFQLKITSATNIRSVNFLDLSVTFSCDTNQVSLSPISKKYPVYPIPSTFVKRNTLMDANIVISQILRTWRISNDNQAFSTTINDYLPFISNDSYHRRLKQKILTFLLPVRIKKYLWSIQNLFCDDCQSILNMQNTTITKIISLNGKFLSSKNPINCNTRNVYILVKEDNTFRMEHCETMHTFIEEIVTKQISISQLLPIGKLKNSQLKNIFKKFNISKSDLIENLLGKKNLPSVAVHHIIRRPSSAYGVRATWKRLKTFDTFFNQYKKISRAK